jgi:protein phosphatase
LFEVGRERKQEDYIWPMPGKATVNDKVFVVCDGAGSFDKGEIASRLICEFMAAKVLKFAELKMSDELINKLLAEARERLVSYARAYRLDTDLSTTFSMLILYDQKVLISWLGNSRIYHVREGEILFSTENNSLLNESESISEISRNNDALRPQNASIEHVIKADSSPIYAETQWIEDVRDGDYFLLCSKGLVENVMDDDIKSLLSRDDKGDSDLARSFNQLAFGKTLNNYSMYLIRVNLVTQKRGTRKLFAINDPKSGIVTPVSIMTMTIVGLMGILFYFRKGRTSDVVPENTNQKIQPVNVLPHDSARGGIIKPEPAKPIPSVTDSVKNNNENSEATPENGKSADIQTEKIQKQADQKVLSQKKSSSQLLLKFTTNESCKLKIKNIDLDEVVDWDLSRNDNGTIYLKPGNYAIIAISAIDSTKIKTYHFDVKPGNATTSLNLHITF